MLVLARNYMQHIKRHCRPQSLVRLNAQTERGHCKGDRRAAAGGYEELRRNILGRPLGASFGAFATQSDRPTIHHVARCSMCVLAPRRVTAVTRDDSHAAFLAQGGAKDQGEESSTDGVKLRWAGHDSRSR